MRHADTPNHHHTHRLPCLILLLPLYLPSYLSSAQQTPWTRRHPPIALHSMDMSSGMSMATSMASGMASGTMAMTAASASATSTGMPGMDMGGSGSDSGMMDMSGMMMVFFTATTTPLYSVSWKPSSTGQYAGTCIFLIALAVAMRALVALRVNFLGAWDTHSFRRGADAFDGAVRESRPNASRPWRINEAAARATLDLVLAGVSYLL